MFSDLNIILKLLRIQHTVIDGGTVQNSTYSKTNIDIY